jgi:hypothetical protein
MSKVSVLAKLRTLLAREAPEQAAAAREGLRRSAANNVEVSVVGAADKPIGGRITMGKTDEVSPNQRDVLNALTLAGKSPVFDFHTHPSFGSKGALARFGVRPSDRDFLSWSDYGPKLSEDRELLTLIAQAPSAKNKAPAAYNFFATNKPGVVFDPRSFENAQKELTSAARPNQALRPLLDDPVIRAYMDRGDPSEYRDLGTLLEEVSPLILLRHQATKGLGRHELDLGRLRLVQGEPEVTNAELFRRMEGPAMQVLRNKKFKQGGAVRSPLNKIKECSCHG